MKTLLQAGFDAYTAIEDFVYEKVFLPEEPQADFDDAKAFAAGLGVELTRWDFTSLQMDFDEM